MALNKRQAKKQEKKKQELLLKESLQRQIKKQTKKSEINVNDLQKRSLRSLERLAQKTKKIQSERRKKQRDNLRTWKGEELRKLGLSLEGVTLTEIDRIKVKDIESGNISKHTYPNLYGKSSKEKPFDFDKEYSLGADRMFFAFRDFAGENSLDDIMKQYEKLSNTQLLKRLNEIVKKKATYKKGRKIKQKDGGYKTIGGRGSSGSAGEYRFMCASASTVSIFNLATYSTNRKKTKRKKHVGAYKGFQILQNDDGKNSFSNVTPRGLLVIMNAFMHNITEDDRVTFYKNVYTAIKKHMPDFAEILPEP